MLLAVSLGLIIGLSLGALGGGGSILTVPALVYALGETAQSATTGSLVIVGITAAAAAVGHARAGRVRWRAGLAFGAAGVAASLVGTHLNARVQPEALLIAFAVLMLIAAAAMLAKTMVVSSPDDDAADEQAAALRRPARAGAAVRTKPSAAEVKTSVRNGLPVLAAGLVVGFLTGFLGVGGGFIIVPALVLTLKYEMPAAVGTSLVIISLNSAVALLARGGQDSFHWAVIVPFTVAAIAGSSAGKTVADRASGPHLTRGFAVLLLLVAGYVMLQSGLSGT
ncbi:MAG: sulfite exporter TauE/SafE family protein [Pseudonocardiales bacterium]